MAAVAEQVMPARPILLASDHAGFALKERIRGWLEERGFDVRDLGPRDASSTDYADYGHPLAAAVSAGEADRGVLLCGSGLGMSFVANRYPNVRAALAWSPEVAALSRSHNDANVLTLPARFVGDDEAREILDRWLDTPFDGGRHERRIEKIERDHATAPVTAADKAPSSGTKHPTEATETR